jgi:hypothetical protein
MVPDRLRIQRFDWLVVGLLSLAKYGESSLSTFCCNMVLICGSVRGIRLSAVRITTKRKIGAVLALVTFEPYDPHPTMLPRNHAPAKSDGFSQRLVRHCQVPFHACGNQFHICHNGK